MLLTGYNFSTLEILSRTRNTLEDSYCDQLKGKTKAANNLNILQLMVA